jgi:glutathione S-transferase
LITLFGNLLSGNVHKAQMILRRRGIPFRRVDVSQMRGEPRRPEFLSVNPIGKVPAVLLEDGDMLSESGAILFYFAQETDLWPQDSRSQAEVLRWMFFEQYSHEPTLAVLRYLKRYAEGPQRYADQIRELEPKGLHALTVMQTRLASADWIAGGQHCTIADYALYPYTRVANESGFDLGDFPAIERWLKRVEAQPGFIAMLVDGADETLSFADYFHPDSSFRG